MNRKLIILLIILFSIFGILLVVDLSTGIWYWNRINLPFDSANFNNILSPIISLVALIVYSVALFFTINQNKLLLSQSLKPHYEMEIERLKNKGLAIELKGPIDENSDKTYNALNYIKEIQSRLVKLSLNGGFNSDYGKYLNNQKLDIDYFKERDYFATVLFLVDFTTILSPVYFFYARVKELITEIENSKLIDDEKLLLKKRIKNEFLEEYISFINFLKTHTNIVPQIPILYTREEIKFESMADTNFASHWKWFSDNL